MGRWFLAAVGPELAFEEWAGIGQGTGQRKGHHKDGLQKGRETGMNGELGTTGPQKMLIDLSC